MIGQDECIFKQFLFTYKQWILPDGTQPPMPKDEGQGVMLSSFVSRDFGYSYELTPSELARVNEFRKGQHYLDKDAAMEVYKKKTILTICPFTVYFK